MATIKSYTTIEQSRKLAEILPLESADLFHFIHEVDTIGFGYKKDAEEFYSKTEFEYIPCWSLASLLGVLPMITKGKDTANPFIAKTPDNEYYVVYATLTKKVYSSDIYDNPIDACYEMILKLKENELI